MIATLSPDQALGYLPDRPFLRAQARLAGIPERSIRQLTTAGRLRSPIPGVLVPTHCPDTLEMRAEAARLVLPDGAALCRITAAWLLGFDARPLGTHTDDPPLECAVPRGVTPMRRPGVRCFVTDLEPGDVVEIGGLPCTTPNRTAVDLARWSSPGTGLGTLDAMTRAGYIDPSELLVQVERWRGAPYVDRARRLIGLTDPRAESYGESWLRLRFHDAGFPPPDLQISLADEDGTELRRLDLGYRARRHAWEYDGEEFHLGLEAEAADRRRREQIERRWGWTVIGVGKNLVLGPSMALEYAVGEVISLQPALRRRTW